MGFRLPKTKGMLRREAASWLARLQSRRDPDVERKFQQWREADPAHSAAFDRVRQAYDQAGLLRHSPTVASSPKEPAIRQARWRPHPALAAAAAVVVLMPIGVLALRSSPLFGTDTVLLMTSVGEIKQVELADGSKITLDSATRVDVKIGRSRRNAHLKYGHARFDVAAGEPFVVETGSTIITTRRAVIDVEEGAQRDRVQVLEGAADVHGSNQAETSSVGIGAGQAAVVNSSGAEKVSPAAPGPDWTRGMLQFDGTPLADAIALANGHSQQHIVLADDLHTLRVTGAFRAGDTIGLAKSLAAAFGLALRQASDGNLILSRPASLLAKKKGG